MGDIAAGASVGANPPPPPQWGFGESPLFLILGYLRGWMWPFGCWMKNRLITTTHVINRLKWYFEAIPKNTQDKCGIYGNFVPSFLNKSAWTNSFFQPRSQSVCFDWQTVKYWVCDTSTLRHWNTWLVSSGASLASWGEGASLALVGNPSSDGITIKMPYGVDVLHRPASHPIFSYWVG